MNVFELLEHYSIPYDRKESDNVYIECPDCGKTNLSINVFSGLWHCWNSDCEEKGNSGSFPLLATKLKMDPNIQLSQSTPPKKDKTLKEEDIQKILHANTNKAEVIAWASSRGLDPSFVLAQGVGYDTTKRAIVFPFRNEKGNLIGAKYKGDNGDQWTKGMEPPLYFLDSADLKKEKIVIVEGEVDALTLKQFKIPCVATLGAGKDKGLGLLRDARQVYIGYDMDPAGIAGAEKIASILGRYRCKKVEWLAKDPNDMLKYGQGDSIIECVKQAVSLATDIKSKKASETIRIHQDQLNRAPRKRISWGYPRLDSFTQGIGGGMYVGILAEAGTGKTTFMINAARNIAHQGISVGICSLEEHPINEVTPKVAATVVGRNPGVGAFSEDELKIAMNDLDRIHLFDGDEELDEIINWVRECYFVHDVKVVFIDYLQWLVPDEKDTELLKRVGKTFKKLVKELPELFIGMIIQPKQANKVFDKHGNEKKSKLDGNSARGGSTINQSVDALLTIKMVDGHSNITQFEYTKVRGHLRVSKKDWLSQFTQLEYDHATLRQVELNHLIYGG